MSALDQLNELGRAVLACDGVEEQTRGKWRSLLEKANAAHNADHLREMFKDFFR